MFLKYEIIKNQKNDSSVAVKYSYKRSWWTTICILCDFSIGEIVAVF